MILSLLLFLTIDTLHLDLDQTIKMGIDRSLGIRKSKEDVSYGRINTYDALGDLLPTPSSYYQIRHTEEFFETTTHEWNLTLNQTIFNTGIIYSIINSFDQLSLSKVSLKEKISSTVYEITESYINLILTFAAQKNLTLSLKRATENHRLAKTRYGLGQTSKLDLLQAEIAVINAEKNLLDNRNHIDQAQQHLQNLLDTNCYVIPSDTLSMPDGQLDVAELKEQLYDYNLLIKSGRINLSTAKKDLLFSYLTLLPTVSAFLNYSYNSYDPPGSLDEIWDNKSRSYGLRIDFPIFNIKDVVLGIMKSKVRKKQAEISLRIRTKEQEENLSLAIRTAKSSLLAIELNKKSLESAREAMRLAQRRYQNGVGSLLSLLTAQSDLERSEANYLKALGDHHLALARIIYLIGKGAE